VKATQSWPNPLLVERAESAFFKRFGQMPHHLAQAPGRVNLLGEHVDYSGGLVLPIAINRWTIAAAGMTSSRSSRLRAEDLDDECAFDVQRPLLPVRATSKRFANHIFGVLSGLEPNGFLRGQLNILVTGTIPQGAGLSSSASLEVATLRACEGFYGTRLENLEAARVAQVAENTFVGTPCGIMDMFVSAAAVPEHALLIDCTSMEHTAIALPTSAEMGILIFDTGVTHNLALSAYGQRRASCQRVEEAFGASLRTLDEATLRTLPIDETDAKRALHVINENARVNKAVAALQAGDLKRFGELLFEGHTSLRDIYEVSTKELDLLVSAASALQSEGVFGARMTGGGFGGCVLVVHKPSAADRIKDALMGAFRQAFGRIPTVFPVRAAGGAGRLY
jgi:galactokinase